MRTLAIKSMFLRMIYYPSLSKNDTELPFMSKLDFNRFDSLPHRKSGVRMLMVLVLFALGF